MKKMCAAAALALFAGSIAAEHARICSDYKSIINCAGKRRDIHDGADFRGDAGTEVISATHGTFVRRSYNECAGHGFFWIDGPGEPTCYQPGMSVPPGKAVAPVRCTR